MKILDCVAIFALQTALANAFLKGKGANFAPIVAEPVVAVREEVYVPAPRETCQTVFDEVWEEKCQTVFEDQCTVDYRKKCYTTSEKECTLKDEEKCEYVPVQKCTSIPVPKCAVVVDKQCSTVPSCKTVYDRVCHTESDRVCHVEYDRECSQVVEQVCRDIEVPVEPVAVERVPLGKKASLKALLLNKKAAKGLFKRSVNEDGDIYGTSSDRGFEFFPRGERSDLHSASYIEDEEQDLSHSHSPLPESLIEEFRKVFRTFPRVSSGSSVRCLQALEDQCDANDPLLNVIRELVDSVRENNPTERFFASSRSKRHLGALKGDKGLFLKGLKGLKHEPVEVHRECFDQPREVCRSVPRDVCVDVPREVCKSVPQRECVDIEHCVDVPRKECHTESKEVCANIPTRSCHTVPREICRNVPRQACQDIPFETCVPVPGKKCEKALVKRPRVVCPRPERVRQLEVEPDVHESPVEEPLY